MGRSYFRVPRGREGGPCHTWLVNEGTIPWYADVVMPALLATARRGYGRAMRSALEAAGYDDIPRAGIRLIGGIARNGPAGPDVSRQLGVRGERTARLVEALVEQGYIAPMQSAGDEGRYDLTDRGRAAARVSADAAEAFETRVRERVGAQDLATARAVLGAMAELSADGSKPA
jgi:DNA-binding MarR family transcriptional regulator